jgi:Ankyrin repeats (many copies)
MHWAAIGGHVKGAELLISAGADLFATTNSGSTALHAAAEAGMVDFVEFVATTAGERKLELFNAKDLDGNVAFDLAKAVCNELIQARHSHSSYDLLLHSPPLLTRVCTRRRKVR